MSRQIVSTKNAPGAIGPYNQAVSYNGLLYTSAQLPIVAETGALADGDIASQTDCVMKNLEAILTAAGTSFSKVLKSTVFITDMGRFSEVNAVYASYFEGVEPPARACVEVSALAKGAMVEIEMVAAL